MMCGPHSGRAYPCPFQDDALLSKEDHFCKTYIYMNNTFLSLIYCFCTFLFRHCLGPRKSFISHRGQSFEKRKERDANLSVTQWRVQCHFFVKSSFCVSHCGFWLPLQCPGIQVCLEAVGAWCFINLSYFIMPYKHCKVFESVLRGQIKPHRSMTNCPKIFSRRIDAIF